MEIETSSLRAAFLEVLGDEGQFRLDDGLRGHDRRFWDLSSEPHADEALPMDLVQPSGFDEIPDVIDAERGFRSDKIDRDAP